jgi:hypothetical protein
MHKDIHPFYLQLSRYHNSFDLSNWQFQKHLWLQEARRLMLGEASTPRAQASAWAIR